MGMLKAKSFCCFSFVVSFQIDVRVKRLHEILRLHWPLPLLPGALTSGAQLPNTKNRAYYTAWAHCRDVKKNDRVDCAQPSSAFLTV